MTRYELVKPTHTWDVNYKVYDSQRGVVYLIDYHDVHEDVCDVENYGGILYSDLIDLNMDVIQETAWAVKEVSSN